TPTAWETRRTRSAATVSAVPTTDSSPAGRTLGLRWHSTSAALRSQRTRRRSERRRRRWVGSGSRNEEDEHVVFQFVIRRSSPAGDGRITRVVTHRLPVTDDGHGFLQTVDPEALSVLIGKEAVLRATFGTESGTNQHEVEEARVAVDTVVQEVSSRFRDLRKRQPAAAAAAAAAAHRNNSSPSSTTPATRPELSPPLPAAVRGRGSGGGNDSSGGSSGGDVGPPSLADAEGGEAGGFSTTPPPPSSGSSTDPHSARAAATAAAVDDSGTSSSNGGGAGAGGGRGIGRPEDAVFPRELGRLPRQLFHLRRGPLLGPLLQNSDDPLCLRHLFLRGALEECLRMMEPSLVSLKATEALACLTAAGNGSGGDSGNTAHRGVPTASAASATAAAAAAALPFPFSRVPVETLAMLADRVLVLDTHDRVFVWSGSAVCGPEFEAVREACRGVFAGEAGARFPYAPVVFLKDGTSWSRYLTSRLIPSHKDPVEDQLRGFPNLAGVPEAEVEQLRAKLPPTDDESYREFFWDVCDPNFQ
ncbi:unnamed protein product, partial [Ectocarpus sp. 12 AP-2014]